MKNSHEFTRATLLATTALLGLAILIPNPASADALLAGTIMSAAGDKMSGVTVSAKAEGSTITTSVYTDEAGGYYFPALPEGKYRVWAQALTFEIAKHNVDLTKASLQNFVMQPMTNPEDWIRQLPGDEFLAALPGDTPDDQRMKTLVRKNCTGCHSASFPLQHRFDAEGWSKILDLMKMVNVLGVYPRTDGKPTGNIEFHQNELAAYLARARGPGESSMKFKLRPRPSGEAARVVYREYDFPMEKGRTAAHDGSDWSLGTPSYMNHIAGVHDVQGDFDGNMWVTYSYPSHDTTVAKIDAKTGAIKNFRLEDQRGIALGTHGIARDEMGVMWFNTRSNVARSHGGLGRIDPRDEKVTVYVPPRNTGGTAGTIDADFRGNIWVTAPDGAFRFNTNDERFTEFKSNTYKGPHGTATVYGLAADRTGNGWWLLMTEDMIDYSDVRTGKTHEIKLPPDKASLDILTADQRKFYATFQPPDFNAPYAWAQAPRRIGADKKGDYVYTGNSFGGSLGRINILTKETTIIPLPNPETDQPYQIAVDNRHNVWTNLWSTDKIAKYDTAVNKWTLFDLPTRGTESRYISILERQGQPMQVFIPYYRARKVAVMTSRTEEEIAALKAQAR